MILPDWITAQISAGYPVWRFRRELSSFYPAGEGDCDNGSTNCYCKTIDEGGALACGERLIWSSGPSAGETEILDMPGGVGYCYDERGQEIPYCAAAPMSGDSSFSPDRGESGPYAAKIVGNSDTVRGMGLRLKRHDQYTLVWQRVDGPEDEPDTPAPGGVEVGALYRVKKANANRIVLVRELEL